MSTENKPDIDKIHQEIKIALDSKVSITNNKPSSHIKDRSQIINYLAIALVSVIMLRVIYLNTLGSSFLEKQLNTRILRTIKLTAMRGTIVDRNNQPLAVSTPVVAIWADPSELNNLTQTQVKQLTNLLEISPNELSQKLSDKNKTFVYLARSLPPKQAKQVLALGIEGIYSLAEYKRYYPSGEVTAHIVGFNNIDDHGADGIEYADDRELQGSDGYKQIIRDLRGHIVDNVGPMQAANNGQKITLAVDNRIQYIAYNALKNQVQQSKAKGGSAVVLDAQTGEVLAMVNMPTYNPNNRSGIVPDMLKNRAATNVYDPGSIMKPLVIAKALDLKMVTPQTVFDTHPWTVGNKLIKDDHNYPQMTVAEIIQHSSDIGTSKIAMKFKAQDLWTYYRQIGFGQKLGTGFPGETSGILLNWKRWYPVDQALMSYGYGISVSLFQMAHAYTIFTNNGCLLPVTFKKIFPDSTIHCSQIIKPETAKVMRKILASTVDDGTGKSAQLVNYTSAGKTGTAQILDGARYSSNKHIGSFVGFAPAINPKIIVAVMIDQASDGKYYGAQTAAPVFAKITEPTLHLLGVTPDKTTTIIGN